MGANRKFNEVPTKATIVPADEVVLVDSEDSLKLKRVSATVFKGADWAQGPQGPQGIPGTPGTWTVSSVVWGTNISVNSTDPANPVVSLSLGTDENFVTDAEKSVLSNTSWNNTGDQDLSGLATLSGATFTGDIIVPDEAYSATTWNGNNEVPTKNAIRDKIESMSVGGGGPSPILTYSTSGVAIAGKVASVRLSQSCTFSKLAISLGVLPVGGTFGVNIKKNGASILSALLTITTSESASNSYYTVITGDSGKATIATTTAVAEDVITCEIVAGSGNTFLGADVNILLTGTLS